MDFNFTKRDRRRPDLWAWLSALLAWSLRLGEPLDRLAVERPKPVRHPKRNADWKRTERQNFVKQAPGYERVNEPPARPTRASGKLGDRNVPPPFSSKAHFSKSLARSDAVDHA
jgi:hypothetical protein